MDQKVSQILTSNICQTWVFRKDLFEIQVCRQDRPMSPQDLIYFPGVSVKSANTSYQRFPLHLRLSALSVSFLSSSSLLLILALQYAFLFFWVASCLEP